MNWFLKSFVFCSTCLAPFLVLTSQSSGQGLDLPRQANTELTFPGPPPQGAEPYTLERLYPQIELPNITGLKMAPGDDSRLFVVSQQGRITIIPNTPDPSPEDLVVALDISDRTCLFIEQGLIGFEFDPDWQTNGYVYVHYVPNTVCGGFDVSPGQRISRFTFFPGQTSLIDPASEELLIEQLDHGPFHYGGDLAFGPDGYLYCALGDGEYPWARSQNPALLLGKILRIDVTGPPDAGLPYAIPPDNPYVGVPDARGEVWARGLRNPFKFAFDPATGTLIACDVGHSSYEEINIITPGASYGWPYREGPECGPEGFAENCYYPEYIDPELWIKHNGSTTAIIGGAVINSERLPEINGAYIFGSVFTGEVFLSWLVDGHLTLQQLAAVDPTLNITAISRMNDGELFFADYADSSGSGYYKTTGGGIYRLARPSNEQRPFPTKLSDNPALLAAGSGHGADVAGVIQYMPSARLWSDSSIKERYLAMPGLAQAEWTAEDAFNFPDGTAVIKNFSLPLDDRDVSGSLMRIETRVMLRDEGQWYGFTYEWNEEQTDAQLLASGKRRAFQRIDKDGNSYNYEWVYPSRSECLQCHTSAANHILGITTGYLNSDFTFPQTGRRANQLATWASIGLFSNEVPEPIEELPAVPDYRDTSVSPLHRMKAYVASNCSMCHRPGGGIESPMDLRWATDLSRMTIVNAVPRRGDIGIPGGLIVTPGDLEHSILYQRLISLDSAYRMPPLGTSQVDPTGEALVREWIMTLPPTNSITGWMIGGD